MTVDTMKVLVSDRGLKHQVFVEHPPVVAGKLRSYISSFRVIKDNIRETYPDARFYFKNVDELVNATATIATTACLIIIKLIH
tara:strand:+ start:438 stop:686 length:249 start_codon:yes stop_codon:yes gene_type:complete